MARCSIESRTKTYIKRYEFLSFARSLYKCLKAGINASKKVIHKAAEATCAFIENKIADTVAKLHGDKIVTPFQEMLER